MDIGRLRREYPREELHRNELKPSPLEQFELWFKEACENTVQEPNAMSLATVSETGCPSLRTVLLKYYDEKGFVFFTNYGSRKAKHIEKNPMVSLLFFWTRLTRQVQICGKVSKISPSESLKYFATRPRGSQLGAWCSQQSSAISTRSLLKSKLEEVKEKFKNREVPLPSFWGGFRVTPVSYEFWQGQPNRLHDRFLYSFVDQEEWEIQRLSP